LSSSAVLTDAWSASFFSVLHGERCNSLNFPRRGDVLFPCEIGGDFKDLPRLSIVNVSKIAEGDFPSARSIAPISIRIAAAISRGRGRDRYMARDINARQHRQSCLKAYQ